jgi:hypothetical protein
MDLAIEEDYACSTAVVEHTIQEAECDPAQDRSYTGLARARIVNRATASRTASTRQLSTTVDSMRTVQFCFSTGQIMTDL